MRHFSVSVGLLLLVAAPSFAATVQIPASRDNTLYQDPAGSLSNGAGTGMFSGRSGAPQNSIRRGLVSFDVASMVPAGSVITSATLTLFQSSANTTDQTTTLHRVLESWGEGTSNASVGGGGGGIAATSGDATWLHRSFNTSLWTTAGGVFSAASSASAVVGGNGFYSWTGAGLIADAQSFLDNGGANFGWLVRGNESAASTAKRFATREEPDGSLRPVLTIEYAVPGAGIGGLGGVLVCCGARRRRR